MDSRELFFDTEIEQAILGNIIEDPKLIYKLNEFTENIFYNTKNSELFGVLRYIMNNKGNIDILLIGDYIKKHRPDKWDISYVSDIITSTLKGSGFDEYVNILIDLYQKRQLKKAINTIDFRKDSDDIKSDILAKMNTLYINREEEDISSVVMNAADKVLSGELEKGVMTGYPSIDNNLLGFNKGELITISARSGVGKTTLAVNMFTYQVYRGYKAHYFSLEMPKEKLIKKMFAIKGHIRNDSLNRNNLTEAEKEHFPQLVNSLADKKFNIYDNNSKIEFIESKIREEKIKNNCDIVYIDLINRVTTNKVISNRAEAIGTITRALKQLAMELEIPIVILAQINRGAEQRLDKRPMLSDLKESGSIEEDSDVVISVYRNLPVSDKNYQGEKDYSSNDPDKNPERVEIGFMKSRYTGNAILPMMYKGDYGIIRELVR